jgi:uncharacterized Zn-binding protein involved in type VI secretion
MPGVARYGDRVQGFCNYAWHWHGTTYYCGWFTGGQWATILEGSNKTKANSKKVARIGDMCQHDYCVEAPYPHDDKGYISSGSLTVKADVKSIARIGDAVSGTFVGIIVTGSSDVNAN